MSHSCSVIRRSPAHAASARFVRSFRLNGAQLALQEPSRSTSVITAAVNRRYRYPGTRGVRKACIGLSNLCKVCAL
jgi:hypothetical protein